MPFTTYVHSNAESSERHPLAKFRPVNEDHAVTQVAFQLRLDEFVEPPVLEAVRSGDPGWKKALPALLNMPPLTVGVGSQQLELPGVQSAIVRPDARPIWAVRLQGFDLTVECSAYTRWKDIAGQATAYLGQAFSLVKEFQADANIVDVRLGVIDQFATDENDYVASELFQPEGLIAAELLRRGGIWHSNSGWLEVFKDVRVLHSLNVQATGKRSSESLPVGPYTVAVNHQQQAAAWPEAPIDPKRIEELMEMLHEANKAVIARLIAKDMLDQIGLKN